MFAVKMTILGTRQLAFGIDGLLKKTSDFRPLWPAILAEFRQMEKLQFTSAGGSGRLGSWPPLKPEYAARKARDFPGKPIMVREGRLMRSLTETGAEGSVLDISEPMRMTIGTAVPYAFFHQRGMGWLPVRRVVDLTNMAQVKIAKMFQVYVNTDALKGFGSQRLLPFGSRA